MKKADESFTLESEREGRIRVARLMATFVHLELQSGEVFAGNHDTSKPRSSYWRTERLGKVAYAAGGDVANGYLPIFMQKSELDEVLQELLR